MKVDLCSSIIWKKCRIGMVHWIVEVGYHLFKDERGGGHIKININKDYQSYSTLDLNRGTKKASF